jgi:hypothetical protein
VHHENVLANIGADVRVPSLTKKVLMKRALFILAVMGSALGAGPTVQAHHSFAATYFEGKLQRIEGELVRFVYRNPHSFIHVDVLDQDGAMQRWAVEWGAGQQLTQHGVTSITLHVGDHLIIEGSPSRTPDDHRLRVRSILRPSDGWHWNDTHP